MQWHAARAQCSNNNKCYSLSRSGSSNQITQGYGGDYLGSFSLGPRKKVLTHSHSLHQFDFPTYSDESGVFVELDKAIKRTAVDADASPIAAGSPDQLENYTDPASSGNAISGGNNCDVTSKHDEDHANSQMSTGIAEGGALKIEQLFREKLRENLQLQNKITQKLSVTMCSRYKAPRVTEQAFMSLLRDYGIMSHANDLLNTKIEFAKQQHQKSSAASQLNSQHVQTIPSAFPANKTFHNQTVPNASQTSPLKSRNSTKAVDENELACKMLKTVEKSTKLRQTSKMHEKLQEKIEEASKLNTSLRKKFLRLRVQSTGKPLDMDVLNIFDSEKSRMNNLVLQAKKNEREFELEKIKDRINKTMQQSAYYKERLSSLLIEESQARKHLDEIVEAVDEKRLKRQQQPRRANEPTVINSTTVLSKGEDRVLFIPSYFDESTHLKNLNEQSKEGKLLKSLREKVGSILKNSSNSSCVPEKSRQRF